MRPARFIPALVATVGCLLALAVVAEAQPPRAPLPLEPEGDRGEAVFPALEGWYRNADGSHTILLGYFNRNAGPVDIPVGPDNQIQPGGPDLGQPSHFHSRRNWGVFAVTVPADFGDQRLTWTLVANNQRSEVSFWLNPPYYLDPFLNRANGNEPPMLKVTASGDERQGPPRGIATTHVATVGEPLVLTAWARDKPLVVPPPPRRNRGGERRERPPLSLTWRKFRGPGEVTFDEATHEYASLDGGESTTSATFSQPGEYRLMVTANDISGNGGGGDQCCWTTAHVDVTVAAAP